MKKTLVIVAIVAILSAFGVYAGEGCPHAKGDAKHECSKECAKKGCTHGKDDACKGMDEACKALQGDLAKMEKGIAPADQDAFLKAHAENLKKIVDMHAKMMGDKKEAKACCKSGETCAAAFKANQADLEKMGKTMTAAEKTDFLKAHQANLKKFLDAKAECEKACKAKGDDKKGCDHKSTEKKADDKK